MINQHAKWLEATVRHSMAQAYLGSFQLRLAPGPQQFSHQDPGFVDIMLSKGFTG